MQKNSLISIIASIILITGLWYVVTHPSAPTTNTESQMQSAEIKDGIQYVTMTAKGGYTPQTTYITSNTPTKLIIKTNNTYDCSAAVVIRSVGFQKILQPTGEEMIDLGTPKAGEKIQGTCSMGMYHFEIIAK